MHHLVVTKGFGKYKIGHEITDPVEVFSVLATKNARNVNKVLPPAGWKPAPEPVAEPEAAPEA